MSSKNGNESSGGIGFCGLLQIAFIVLKLCRVINWSWIWVLAPMWVPICIMIVAVLTHSFIVFFRRR